MDFQSRARRTLAALRAGAVVGFAAARQSPWTPLLVITVIGWAYAITYLVFNGGPTVAGDEWNYGIAAYEVCAGDWPLYYNRTDIKLGALEAYTAAPFVCLLANKAWALKIAALSVHTVGGFAFARIARAIAGAPMSAGLALLSWWFGPMLLLSWAWRVNSYGMLLTGGCVLIACGYAAVERERSTPGWLAAWLGYGILAGLLTWSHPATLLFVGPMALWLAVDLRARLAARAVTAAGFLIGMLPAIVFNFERQPTVDYVSGAVTGSAPTHVLSELVGRGVVRLGGAILPWQSPHWLGGVWSLLQIVAVIGICAGLASTCAVAVASLRRTQRRERPLAPVLLGLFVLHLVAYTFSSWGISGKARYVLMAEVVALCGLPVAAGLARRYRPHLTLPLVAAVALQLLATTLLAVYNVDGHLLDGAHRPATPGPLRPDRMAAALRARGVTTVYGNHYTMGPIAYAGEFLWNDQFQRPRDWGDAARAQPAAAKAIICDGAAFTEGQWRRWLGALGIAFDRLEVDDVVALHGLRRSAEVLPAALRREAPPAAFDLDPYSVWRPRSGPPAAASIAVVFARPVDLDRMVLWMSEITVQDRGIAPSRLIYEVERADGSIVTDELAVASRLEDGILAVSIAATGVTGLRLRQPPEHAVRWGLLELGLFGRESRAALP